MDGKRLKYYRLKKGLTMEELAKRIKCTKAAISQYENGTREPNADIVRQIADALDISWLDLVTKETNDIVFNHVSFRKKQKVSKSETELLKFEIEQKCSDYVSLMNILGITDFVAFKPLKLSFEDTALFNSKAIRNALNIPLNGPIYSVVDVLENAGIIVLSFGCDDDIDGLNGMVNNIPYVFFNSNNRSIERQRFTLVHEACHLFFNNSLTSMSEKEIEKYINLVAGNVLVPTQDLYSIFGSTIRNLTIHLRDEIAKRYKVSPSCLINRMHEEDIITDFYHKNFFIFLSKKGGRTKEESLLDPIRDLEIPSIFSQRVYLALNNELISASKASEYLHIPLYEIMKNMRAN